MSTHQTVHRSPHARGHDLTLASIVTALLGSSGCRVVEGIFKAGIWTGVVAFVLVCAVVFGLMRIFARG